MSSACLCLWKNFSQRISLIKGFPGGSDGKEHACNAEDLGSVPGLGLAPEEGNGNPLQNSCLENPLDRGAWRATVHGVAGSDIFHFMILRFTFSLNGFYLLGILTEMIMVSGVCFKIA